MAVKVSQAIAVGTSAVALTSGTVFAGVVQGCQAMLYNTGSATVFLGDSTVTAATGFPMPATDTLAMPLQSGETIYGICAAATSSTVAVLETGV